MICHTIREAFGGELERSLGDVAGHGAGAAVLLNEAHRSLQSGGALLQSLQKLLLSLLMREQLLVVADTHADKSLTQLITDVEQ